MEGISVIITAYQAFDFIDECLNGFLEQKTKVPYEVLVAVDGCRKTLDKVKEYKDIDVYYSKKNVGTFKNRNALAEKAIINWLILKN